MRKTRFRHPQRRFFHSVTWFRRSRKSGAADKTSRCSNSRKLGLQNATKRNQRNMVSRLNLIFPFISSFACAGFQWKSVTDYRDMCHIAFPEKSSSMEPTILLRPRNQCELIWSWMLRQWSQWCMKPWRPDNKSDSLWEQHDAPSKGQVSEPRTLCFPVVRPMPGRENDSRLLNGLRLCAHRFNMLPNLVTSAFCPPKSTENEVGCCRERKMCRAMDSSLGRKREIFTFQWIWV